jgi:DNA-directed RNA polymerase specialized sigma24 family protein
MSNAEINGSDQLSVIRDGEIGAEPSRELEGAAKSLPLAQQTALELLVTGKSIAETARSAGVSRTTIYQWMRKDPVFRAAYNEWHDQLRESSRSRLLMLTEKATDAVEKAVEGGNARMAMQLLKGMGMVRDLPPGPTDPAEVKRISDLQQKRRMTLLDREERDAREDESMSRMGI